MGNQGIAAWAVATRRLRRISINKKSAKHGMVKTTNLVLDTKHAPAILRIDHFLKTKLMIPNLLRNQSTTFQKPVGPRKIRHVDRYMVPIILSSLFGFAKDQ